MSSLDRSDFVAKPGPNHAIQFDESRDLEPYRRVMQPIPDRVAAAITRGVTIGEAAYLADPNRLLAVDAGGDGLVDGVIRTRNGELIVACLTEMPGVQAHMWDWWFAWHSYASKRYRLWHPEDHIAASMAHDRRHLPRIRDRWVGNTSYVDELVGGELQRLEIRFVPPASVGLDAARVDEIGVAICARVVLRRERLAVGHLIHLVEDTSEGCRMHSRFRLGDAESELPVVGPIVTRLARTRAFRLRRLPDATGLALLYHCAQEMNHLAMILPDLHERFGSE